MRPSDISVAVGLVIIAALVLSKMRGRQLRPRRRIVAPLVILLGGAAVLVPQVGHMPAVRAVDFVVGGLDIALSVVLGIFRGRSVSLTRCGDAWWYRYGSVTVALWALSIVARTALGIVGAGAGAMTVVTSGSALLMLGLSLLSQNLTVLARVAAMPTGAGGPALEPAAAGHRARSSSPKGRS